MEDLALVVRGAVSGAAVIGLWIGCRGVVTAWDDNESAKESHRPYRSIIAATALKAAAVRAVILALVLAVAILHDRIFYIGLLAITVVQVYAVYVVQRMRADLAQLERDEAGQPVREL